MTPKRRAVVTGATGGIGSAVVRALVSRDFDAYAVSRSPRAESGTIPVALDLAQPFELPADLAGLSRLDTLVHCAGIADVADVSASDPDLWQRVLTVNLTSAATLTRLLLPALRAARGSVVFVNMSAGLRGVPGWSAYTASKAGLAQLADSLRAEEQPYGVRVTTVYPAGTATPLLARVRSAFGRPYDPATSIQPDTLASYVLLAADAPRDAYVAELTVIPAP